MQMQQHGCVRTSPALWAAGVAPTRHGHPGSQQSSYVAPPVQGQSPSWVPPAHPVETLNQAYMPAANNPNPRNYRRGVSPPHTGHAAPPTLQPSYSVSRLENGAPAPTARKPLSAAPDAYSRHPPSSMYEHIAPPTPTALGGMASPGGGYQDTLQQDFREQRQPPVKTSRSPVQEPRDARAHVPATAPARTPAAPERMRSARGSYGNDSDLRAQLEALRSQLGEKDREIQSSREKYERLRSKADELKQKAEEYKQRASDMSRENQELKERERTSTERQANLQGSLADREAKLADREAKLADREAERERKLDDREKKLADREETHSQHLLLLQKREAKLADREADCRKNEAEIAEESDTLRNELEERRARLDEWQRELEEKKRHCDEEEDRLRTRERQHAEACREAQAFRTTRRPSPRTASNKENMELMKQLEEQREGMLNIKQQGWKQPKPEVVDGLNTIGNAIKSAGAGLSPAQKSAGTGEMAAAR